MGNRRELENGAIIGLSANVMNTSINSSINITENEPVIINSTETGTWLNITVSANLTASIAIVAYNETTIPIQPTGVQGLDKYIDVLVDNNTDNNISSAQVRIYYTDAEVSAKSLVESSLRLYKYNETSAAWELTAGSVETSLNYVWGDISRFCSFGIFGTLSATPQAQAAASSSSGIWGRCTAKWQCSEWSECMPNGKQARTCEHVGTCGILDNKPDLEKECEYKESQIVKETVQENISEKKPIEPQEKPYLNHYNLLNMAWIAALLIIAVRLIRNKKKKPSAK